MKPESSLPILYLPVSNVYAQQAYQLQQAQQILDAQQMCLYRAQQVAIADVAVTTNTKRHGNRGKNKKSCEKQGATKQTMVRPRSPDPVSCPGKDRENNRKHMLLEAVKSLYKDQIVPQHVLVLRRIQEKYGERWSPQQLTKVCREVPEIQLVTTGDLKRCNVILRDPPKGLEELVDQSSPEDPFNPDLWLEVKTFLEDESHKPQTGWPSSRYEFATFLHNHLQCLQEYSLGKICHLVQLSVTNKELLGYRTGNLVPYHLSDDFTKRSNAFLNAPTQILPGEMYVETWKQAGELIACLLDKNGGSLQLSSLKKMFREEYQMELSESAMGHAKLSGFLKDHRLKSPSGGTFHLITQRACCIIVLMEPSEQKHMEPADSDAKSTAASDDSTPRGHSQLSPGLSPYAGPAFLPPPGLEGLDYSVASPGAGDDPLWIHSRLPLRMQF